MLIQLAPIIPEHYIIPKRNPIPTSGDSLFISPCLILKASFFVMFLNLSDRIFQNILYKHHIKANPFHNFLPDLDEITCFVRKVWEESI